MDDDDEIYSDPSHATPSPTPSPPRATVYENHSSAPPSSQPLSPSNLALTLPSQHLQQRHPGGGGASGGREDCWSEGATAVLIDAWGERYLELSRGNLKQKHWGEVAEIVRRREGYTKTPKTDVQCKNRIDTVKKKYKIEKAKIATGGGPSSWVFFDKLDRLIGQTSTNSKSLVALPPQNPNPNPNSNPKVPISSGLKLQNPDVKGSKTRLRKRNLTDSESEPDDLDSDSNDGDDDDGMNDSLHPKTSGRKKAKVYKEVKDLGRKMAVLGRSGLVASGSNLRFSIRELTRAIMKFGEVYEKTENAKLHQIVEVEKQRMQFAKDMELQRAQFFTKTQLEISQLKGRDKGGGGSRNHRANNGENNSSGSSD